MSTPQLTEHNTRDWRQVAPVDYSTGDRVCAFIEQHCRVPEGRRVGEAMVLETFQRAWIYDTFDNPAGTRRSILSMARKNGKTSLIAAILLCMIVGPLARQNAQCVSGAMAREQAAVVYKLALKMVGFSPVLNKRIRAVPSRKEFFGLTTGMYYQALSAEASTKMGLSPFFIILDETGQIEGPIDDFVDALTTAQGAYDDGMQIVITTQARSDLSLLSSWIDDALNSNNPHLVCHLYAADKKAGLDDWEEILKANPGAGTIRSIPDLRQQIEEAKRLPAKENAVRNLLMNQRVSVSAPFLAPAIWDANDGAIDIEVFRDGRPVYAGLDLSQTTDLTALVLACQDDEGRAQLLPMVWTPADTLQDRGIRDRAPYVQWEKEQILITTPGKVIGLEWVVQAIAETIEGMNLQSTNYDRWRIKTLRAECEKIGLDLMLVECGQGFKDMAPAIDAFEARALNGALAHGANPLMRWAVGNSVIVFDPAGNRKINKAKSFSRVDPVVAAIMAVKGMDVDTEFEPDLLTLIG